MGVHPFGGLNRRMAQPLGDVVEGVSPLAIEHPIGDAVAQRVRRHLPGGATALDGERTGAIPGVEGTSFTFAVVG